MRSSDEKKNPFAKYQDAQISGNLHDQIMFWLYAELETNLEILKEVTNPTDQKE